MGVSMLHRIMTYMTEGENIKWGDRFPFSFHRCSTGALGVQMGNPKHWTLHPWARFGAVLFWPFLFLTLQFFTSTGKFMVMVATGITQREWELAKQTTTVHVQLLLCRAGVSQRTMPERECLLGNPRWVAGMGGHRTNVARTMRTGNPGGHWSLAFVCNHRSPPIRRDNSAYDPGDSGSITGHRSNSGPSRWTTPFAP